jgi:hypothetical protein
MGWDTIPPVLIDMEKDIGEKHDVAAEHPEVVQDLSSQFQAWLSRQTEPLVYPLHQWNKLKQVK